MEKLQPANCVAVFGDAFLPGIAEDFQPGIVSPEAQVVLRMESMLPGVVC